MKAQQYKPLTAFSNKKKDIQKQSNEEIFLLQKKCTNLNYLKQLTKNNPRMIAEMIEVYLEETPQLVNTMKKAIDTSDWESLRNIAHSIRPSFLMMGVSKEFENTVKKVQEYATLLRDVQANKGTVPALNELFFKIETVSAKTYDELQKELTALKVS